MDYVKNIEIYRIKAEFYSPLASNPNKAANCSLGDTVVIIDGIVYIRDWNDEREEQFAQALYSAEFVKLNPNIFDKTS